MHKTNSVLITGASRGIGLEFARQYTQAGWRVYATCRNPERAQDLNELASGSKMVSVYPMDVTNMNHIIAIKDILRGQPLDMLINNAGVLGPTSQSFGHTDIDAWVYTMRVNAIGPLKVLESLVENLAVSERRLVVNLTSRMGSITDNHAGGYYLYRSSKAALNSTVRNAALDLAARDIIVIALHPGWVRTDMGGTSADIEIPQSVVRMRAVLDHIGAKDSGKVFDLDGTVISW